jgi:LacI family transcriptional regulator
MSETHRVVLLMIPSTGYDRGLLEGITRYAQIHGPWVFYLAGDHPDVPLPLSDSISGNLTERMYASRGAARRLIPNLQRWRATGVIGRILDLEMAKNLLSSGLPIIGITNLSEKELNRLDFSSKASEIRTDLIKSGKLAAEHFLDRGFWNFAFCGYEGRSWSERRLEGFAERLRQAGFVPHAYQAAHPRRRLTWKQELPQVMAWLKSLPRPVALMACNDKRGRQVLEAALMSGLEVPEDVAVVGVDNDHLFGNLSNPPLSSVALNLSKAGYQAAELFDLLVQGKVRKPQRILIEALWVVTRRSSDVIALADRHAAAALRFIRDHARQPIDVADVVRQAGISRRGLEIRFRRALGRSIRDEIQRNRLVYSKQLLVETNLPLERIARLAGFCSPSHFGSVFRLENGTTPADFRRQMCIH